MRNVRFTLLKFRRNLAGISLPIPEAQHSLNHFGLFVHGADGFIRQPYSNLVKRRMDKASAIYKRLSDRAVASDDWRSLNRISIHFTLTFARDASCRA